MAKNKTKEAEKKKKELRQNKIVLRILWTFQPGWGERRGGAAPPGAQETDLAFSAFSHPKLKSNVMLGQQFLPWKLKTG